MAVPTTSIFISHVNGDPEAEEVLQALIDEEHGLKRKLQPSHDAYEIAYDREIIAGTEWRRTIYQWLVDCAAAVFLVSKQAFDPDKPWVSHEATALTITQTRRPELCIIPVLLQGAASLLASRPTFNPGRLPAIQALRFPDPPRITALEALVTAIAERLKQELPRRDMRPLAGLAAQLRDTLSDFPEPTRRAAAAVLNPADVDTDAAQLANEFLAADEIRAQQAFRALCDKARETRFFDLKHVIAHILGAQKVREEDAKPIAVEAASPNVSGCRRALLLDNEDPDIVDLYLTRAALRCPHAWDVINVPGVLEFGHLEDLKKSVRKTIGGKFGRAAGQSDDMQLRRGNAVVGSKRRSGFPVLLRLKYPVDRDPATAFHAVREICPELMVLYTAPPETLARPPIDPAVCQIAPLGIDGYDQVIGPFGALIDHCRATTPKKDDGA